MKQLMQTVCAAGLLLVSAGCSAFFGTSGVTQTFILNVPAVKEPVKGVAVEPFTSSSPAKYKMLVRKGNQIQTEPRAKWAMTPEQMLTVCYKKLFASAAGINPVRILSGEVLEFAKVLPETGKEQYGSAVLTVKYSLKSASGTVLCSRLLTDSEPVANPSPEAFAAAMNKVFARQYTGLIQILRAK